MTAAVDALKWKRRIGRRREKLFKALSLRSPRRKRRVPVRRFSSTRRRFVSLVENERRENRFPFPFADMSVTQPPPSSVPVRRSRIPLKTSSTTFLRRRPQRGASAVLPCRGLLGFACRFRRFSSSAPFGFSSLVAARRLFDIINTILSVLLTLEEPTRSWRRRSVSILPRFDAKSFRNVYFASRFLRRRSVCLGAFVRRQARRGAVVLGSGAPSNLGETPT